MPGELTAVIFITVQEECFSSICYAEKCKPVCFSCLNFRGFTPDLQFQLQTEACDF